MRLTYSVGGRQVLSCISGANHSTNKLATQAVAQGLCDAWLSETLLYV
jgi:hypothetical protein